MKLINKICLLFVLLLLSIGLLKAGFEGYIKADVGEEKTDISILYTNNSRFSDLINEAGACNITILNQTQGWKNHTMVQKGYGLYTFNFTEHYLDEGFYHSVCICNESSGANYQAGLCSFHIGVTPGGYSY